MKKLVVGILMLVMVLSSVSALAAEWPEGRSPEQPYSNVPKLNLGTTVGYIMLYPREKMPAMAFCDLLEIYLPREDVELGKGTLELWKTVEGAAPEKQASVTFGENAQTSIRPLEDNELAGLMWGSGVCIEVYLEKSLEIGADYYVLMDEGCFTADNGAISNPAISEAGLWVPVLEGEYGVGGLYYSAEAEGTEPGAIKYKDDCVAGDILTFNLVLGGEVERAVVYSENDSVFFDELEYTETCTVTGKIVGEDVRWGVVFLDANGDVLDALNIAR